MYKAQKRVNYVKLCDLSFILLQIFLILKFELTNAAIIRAVGELCADSERQKSD